MARTRTAKGRYDQLLCFNFYRGWRAIQAYYARCFEPRMNPQRIYILGLCGGEGSTISAIAAALHIDLPAVSAIVDRMERDGLVKRTRSAHNRREVIVTATEEGERAMHETDERLREADRALFRVVKTADISHLHRIVAAIDGAMSQQSEVIR